MIFWELWEKGTFLSKGYVISVELKMGLEGKLETVGERLNLFTKETGLSLKLKQKT